MPSRLEDDDILNVDTRQLAEYLVSRGWELLDQVQDKATIWELSAHDAEIWLPLRNDLRDYVRRLNEVFDVLESVEHRSARAILQDLSLSNADLVRFRVTTGMFRNYTVPLSDGVALVKSARDVILSGARWLVEPKAAYYNRPTSRVSSFLRALRLGQTEVGSYVVTVISPLANREPQFSRDFMLQVFKGIQLARASALTTREGADMKPFDDAAALGVNANLCDALVSLGQSSPDGAAEVDFSWSSRIDNARQQRESITLDASLMSILRTAAERLRELEPITEADIRGFVQEMTDRSAEDLKSEITMVAVIDNQSHKVRLDVSEANRLHAIEAFEKRLPIVVHGTLNRSRQPYKLSEIKSVRILGDTELFAEPDPNELSE